MHPFDSPIILRLAATLTTDIIPETGSLRVDEAGILTIKKDNAEVPVVQMPLRDIKAVKHKGAHASVFMYLGLNEAYEITFLPDDPRQRSAAEQLTRMKYNGIKEAFSTNKEDMIARIESFKENGGQAQQEVAEKRRQFVELSKNAGVYKKHFGVYAVLLMGVILAALMIYAGIYSR